MNQIQDSSCLKVFILENVCAGYRSNFCNEVFIKPWTRSGHVLISFSEKSNFKIQDGRWPLIIADHC